MEGTIRRIIVNAFLFVGLSIALVVCAVVSVSDEPTQYELPKLLSSQSERIVKHTGYTVSFNTQYIVTSTANKPASNTFNIGGLAIAIAFVIINFFLRFFVGCQRTRFVFIYFCFLSFGVF